MLSYKYRKGRIRYPVFIFDCHDKYSASKLAPFLKYINNNWHNIPVMTRYDILLNQHGHWNFISFKKIEDNVLLIIYFSTYNGSKTASPSDMGIRSCYNSFQCENQKFNTQCREVVFPSQKDGRNCAVFAMYLLLKSQHLDIHDMTFIKLDKRLWALLASNTQYFDMYNLFNNPQHKFADTPISSKGKKLKDYYAEYVTTGFKYRNLLVNHLNQMFKIKTLPFIKYLLQHEDLYDELMNQMDDPEILTQPPHANKRIQCLTAIPSPLPTDDQISIADLCGSRIGQTTVSVC